MTQSLGMRIAKLWILTASLRQVIRWTNYASPRWSVLIGGICFRHISGQNFDDSWLRAFVLHPLKNAGSRESKRRDLHLRWLQAKMRGQRGRLPVQVLGYVNSTKVILGWPETAGVHFLLRPHHYILKVPLWSKSRHPFFYVFVHNRSFLVILPNSNLLRTLQPAMFGPLFPRI